MSSITCHQGYSLARNHKKIRRETLINNKVTDKILIHGFIDFLTNKTMSMNL